MDVRVDDFGQGCVFGGQVVPGEHVHVKVLLTLMLGLPIQHKVVIPVYMHTYILCTCRHAYVHILCAGVHTYLAYSNGRSTYLYAHVYATYI